MSVCEQTRFSGLGPGEIQMHTFFITTAEQRVAKH